MPRTILDYGCGLGGNYKFIGKRGDYYGVDILPENIAYAAKRYPAGTFTVTPPTRLEFADNFFTEVHAYDVFEHVEDLSASLREVDRVLAPGGQLFVVVPAAVSEKKLKTLRPTYWEEIGHVRIVDPDELGKTLAKMGFREVKRAKTRGVEALAYAWLFKHHATKRMVRHQTGSPEFSKWLVAAIWLFDTRLFITPLKYLFFVYWLTLPIGWLVSRWFPKSYYLIFQK